MLKPNTLEDFKLDEIQIADTEPIVDVLTEDIYINEHLVRKGTLFTIEE